MNEKPTYIVEKSRMSEESWEVVRRNAIGQGWHVATYESETAAEVVKNCLNFHAEDEA